MIHDEFGAMPTASTVEEFHGRVWGVRTDDVIFEAQTVARNYVVHFGAVAVVALDADDRVLLIQQYRHPLAARTWEIPAGLLDVPGEDPFATIQRELAEEAGYRADTWSILTDYATTPGGSTEIIRIYCARDLTELPERPHTDEAEEQDMPRMFLELDTLRDAILAGQVANTSLVVGALAACAARDTGWRSLRPADSAWPLRDHLHANDRIFRR